MKLKYKKTILIITMVTMYIGFVAFSLASPASISSKDVEKSDKKKSEEPSTKDALIAKSEETPEATLETGAEDKVVENANTKINQLIKDYFDASVGVDMKALKGLVSNIEHIDEDALRIKYKDITGYENINCYTVDGPKEGTYCVYVYIEFKIKDVKTSAPGLVALYLTTNDKGKVIVHWDTLDEETQQHIQEMNKSPEVVELSESVNVKLQEAIDKDKDLKAYYTKSDDSSTASPEPTDSAKSEE